MTNLMLMKVLAGLSLAVALVLAGVDYGETTTEKKYAIKMAEKDVQIWSARGTVLEIERQSAIRMVDDAVKREQATIDARKQSEKLQLDIDRLSAANDSLRDKAKRYSDRLQRCATVAAGSDTTTPSGDLLPDMLGRCGEALGIVSEYADRARISGLTCERLR